MSYANALHTASESKHMKGRSNMKIRNLTSLLMLLLTTGLVLVCAPVASAAETHNFEESFGPDGTARTAFEAPGAVAVDESSGEIYVADFATGTVQKFNAAHRPSLLTGIGARISGSQLTGFSFRTGEPMTQLAVDSSKHVLYVTNTKSESEHDGRLEAFQSDGEEALFTAGPGAGTNAISGFRELCGVAVDANGDIYTADYLQGVHVYAPSGKLLATVSLEQAGCFLAVDSHGTVYVNKFQGSVQKLTPSVFPVTAATTFSAETTVDANGSKGVAVDPATNHLYVAEHTEAGSRLAEYDEAGALLQTFAETGEGALGNSEGVAVDDFAAGKVLASDKQGKRQVEIWSPTVKLPAATTGAASGATTTSVRVAGEVNPEGANITTCIFEYGTTSSYGQSVPCVPANPGSGTANVPLSAELKGLVPGSQYHYRLSVANANSPRTDVFGADATFFTGAHLESEFASDVTDETATLNASIDPQGAFATCRFQYVTQAEFESSGYSTATSVPCPAALGSGEARVPVSVSLAHLSPKSAYRYRVLVSSLGEEIPGADQTFTTEGSGGTLALPDNRGWELVSPPNKQGALIEPLSRVGIDQAAASGDAMAYLTATPTEAVPAGYANEVQVLSHRGPAGWSSRDLALAHSAATGIRQGPENKLFNTELTEVIVSPEGAFNPALSEDATESTPFLRNLGATCGNHCLTPIVTGKPGIADVPEGTEFGEGEECEPTAAAVAAQCGPEPVGATDDLSHVIVESEKESLGSGALPDELFEWVAGTLTPVSVLPGPEHQQAPAALGYQNQSTEGAISSNGNRVFWETGGDGEGELYVRDMSLGQSLRLDSSEGCGTCTSGPGATFAFASSDGTRVFFTDPQHLTDTAGAQPGVPDLYECHVVVVSESLRCNLTDLTPPNGTESADVLGGPLGAATDGSSIYFVATGIQSHEADRRGQRPVAGQPNLYLDRDGATEFIATLSEGDTSDWNGQQSAQPARVSPNGQFVAFMSQAQPTGYDNSDSATGEPAAEVYVYDSGSRRLSCVSCQPSGARPTAVEYSQIEPGFGGGIAGAPEGEWPEKQMVAATLPGWPGMSRDGQWARHQPRYLTDEGRVFFNTDGSLVPQDSNGTQDVYEFEPPGVGSCAETSGTYDSGSGGCVALISSGSSAQESAFLDASESGDDVFFLTSAKLSPIDVDSARDVYDAHVCTSASPCITFPDTQSPPCTNESSCKPSPTPQPSVFGAPASATFSGAGNPPPSSPPQATKPKPKSAEVPRPQRLGHALKACRAKHNKRKRQSCERSARKRYPAKKAAARKSVHADRRSK